MKNSKIWHLGCLMLASVFAACSSDVVTEVETGFAELHFSVSPYEKIPMDADTRSVAAKDALKYLSIAFFKDGQLVDEQITQTYGGETDTEFGTFAKTLPYGTYQLVVIGVGKNGSGAATINSPQNITFANGEVTETYSSYQTLTVTKDSEKSLAVSLTHTVARFKMITLDNSPSTISTLSFRVVGGGVALNATTGTAVESAEQTKTFNVASLAGKVFSQINIYTFLTTTAETAATITVTAKDAENNILMERTFTDVPLQIGYSTTYRGNLFSNDGTWSISVQNNDFQEMTETPTIF